MKTIIFNYENIIEYSEYQKIIKELSEWYQQEYSLIKDSYNNLLKNKNYINSFNIINNHNKLMIELLKKIILYLKLDKKDIGIYLSNSFARETNLLDSDVDINFIYNDKELYIYEELSASILYQVLGKYRDFVHDSISHRFVNNKDNSEVEYELLFNNKKITEKITNGNEAMMYNLFNTKKDINSFYHYYTEMLNNKNINEWIFFQKPLTEKYTLNLLDYIRESSKKSFIYNRKDKIVNTIKDIKNELEILSKLKIDDISIFKKYYKNHVFKYIYETLVELNQYNNNFNFISVQERLVSLNDIEFKNMIEKYFGLIMIFNLLCDKYGVEFRTRYSTKIEDGFIDYLNKEFGNNLIDEINKQVKNIYNELINKLNNLELDYNLDYNIDYEHINIKNYSPLSHINNSSPCYQTGVYLLPFIEINSDLIPVHPDTLDDLNLSREKVAKYELVAPTSSTRTVFSLEKKVYYKLALTRQITRSIRDLKNKELKRSEIALSELLKIDNKDLIVLKENCFYNKNEIFNYIIREYPNKRLYPWFYLIVTNTFSKEKMINLIYKMVDIWLFYASKGIYFESAHTQNFLVDEDLNIYYRDLSDIRILKYDIMMPSYYNELNGIQELHSIFFDRSMLSQNIQHFINNYNGVCNDDIENIKNHIKNSIQKYNISFPNYSVDYDKQREGHHPVKVKLNELRKQ